MPRAIALSISTHGKHRDHGYKVGKGEAVILNRAGWTITKRGKTYHYVQPPAGVKGGGRIAVMASVPTDDEIVDLAHKAHAAGEPCVGTLHGWPYGYKPQHKVTTTVTSKDPFSGADLGTDVYERTERPSLQVGLLLLWNVRLEWLDDDKSTFVFRSQEKPPVTETPSLFPPKPQDPQCVAPPTFDPGYIACEGTPYYAEHLRHERDRRIVDQKKAQVWQETGQLACEICGFDFAAAYGGVGKGLVDCHHRKPVASLREGEPTTLDDLAVVCCNCHPVLHRTAQTMTVEELHRAFEETRRR